MIQNLFVLTAAQAVAAAGFDTEDVLIGTRAIDATNPGVGINLNPDAIGVDAGAVLPLIGMSIAPVRILNDPAYPQGMKDYLIGMPWALLDSDTIFAPPDPNA